MLLIDGRQLWLMPLLNFFQKCIFEYPFPTLFNHIQIREVLNPGFLNLLPLNLPLELLKRDALACGQCPRPEPVRPQVIPIELLLHRLILFL